MIANSKYFLLLLFSFSTIVLSAQSPIDPLDNVETWYDKVPVSGEIRTGLVTCIDYSIELPRVFYVNIPKSNKKILNVEITSNDGRYTAHMQYPIEGMNGNHAFKWKSDHFNKLKSYSPNDVTLLSWLTENKDQDKTEFVISSWDNTANDNIVYIVLNSSKKTLININNNTTGSNKTISCVKYQDKPNVSYNCYCPIETSLLEGDVEVSIVQKSRRARNSYTMNIKL